jgi:hypothetical protein
MIATASSKVMVLVYQTALCYMTLESQIAALFSLVNYTVNALCFICSHLSKVKVIDMTGPQQRVLSGYHAIAGQQRPADEWELRKDKKFVNFALPELQHNLNLLMDMCEQVNTT